MTAVWLTMDTRKPPSTTASPSISSQTHTNVDKANRNSHHRREGSLSLFVPAGLGPVGRGCMLHLPLALIDCMLTPSFMETE